MPNFLIIEAPRCGTTSLYNYLKQHPEIYMSSLKEPRFFAPEGERPVKTLEAYQRLFEGVRHERAIGEASTPYLSSPAAPGLIRDQLPGAKLIAILRDPVARAYSHFLYGTRRDRQTDADLLRWFEEDRARRHAGRPSILPYRERSLYAHQVRRYLENFPSEQLRIYLYDDFSADPVKVVRDVFEFLDVAPDASPRTWERHNAARIPRSRIVHEFLFRESPLKGIARTLLPSAWRHRIWFGILHYNSWRPRMEPSIRSQLVEEFRSDILELQELIERDLSKWLET